MILVFYELRYFHDNDSNYYILRKLSLCSTVHRFLHNFCCELLIKRKISNTATVFHIPSCSVFNDSLIISEISTQETFGNRKEAYGI